VTLHRHTGGARNTRFPADFNEFCEKQERLAATVVQFIDKIHNLLKINAIISVLTCGALHLKVRIHAVLRRF